MAEEEETPAENQEPEDDDDDSFDYSAYGLGLGDMEEGGDKGGKHVIIMLEEDSSKFKPELYTFRRTDPKSVARGPPFWVLTDHLIAVIWNLFKVPPAEEPLGISQLQWGLEFLRSIRDDTGEYPGYVQISINQLEDRLLELYASVPFFTEEPGEEEEPPREKVDEEIDEGGEEGEEEADEEEEGEEKEGGEEAVNEEGEEGEGEPVKKKKKKKSIFHEEVEDESVRQTFGSLVEIDRPSIMTRRISEKVKKPELQKDLAASVTLKDIMTKVPKKQIAKDELNDYLTAKASGPSIRSSGPGSQTKLPSPPNASQGEMLKFLNSLRKEQTDRINIELKQLDKIDEFMKDVQTGNCSMGETAIKALYER